MLLRRGFAERPLFILALAPFWTSFLTRAIAWSIMVLPVNGAATISMQPSIESAGTRREMASAFGAVDMSVDANEVIWSSLSRYRLPG